MTRDPYRTLVQLSTRQVINARTMALPELLDGARAGYAPYIGELRVRFGDELEHAIRHLVFEAAGEIVDDVFMDLPRTLEHYVEDGRFGGWLFGQAFNRARTRARSVRRRPDGGDLPSAMQPSSDPTVVHRLTADALLERALEALSASEREAWLLSYHGQEPREIAEVLGIAVSAATVRVHRARKRLEVLLSDLARESA